MFKWLEAVRATSPLVEKQAPSAKMTDDQDGLGPEYVCGLRAIEVVDISPPSSFATWARLHHEPAEWRGLWAALGK